MTALSFLVLVVVVSGLGATVVAVRSRPRTSVGHTIREFERGLRALAPESDGGELDERGPGRRAG